VSSLNLNYNLNECGAQRTGRRGRKRDAG